MNKAHVAELASKHAALDSLINQEEHRPLPDVVRIHELKREKLKLKDRIAGHFAH